MRRQHLLYVLITLLLASCVTTRKSKQDTGWMGKRWHDMNARYNGIFNARELMKANERQRRESHEDNYAQILNIEFYGEADERDAYKADMDIVVEKATKVAALHEPSKWVDDCYVLIGRAQFTKGDLESAQETFEYFVDDFNPKDPDSRVYESPDRKESAKERRKKAQNERKIQQDQREKERKEKEKTRKQELKERKKAQREREKERKQRAKDRKKGIRTPPKKEETETTEVVTPPPTAVADTGNDIPIDPDEAYIRELERKQEEKKEEKVADGGGLFKQRPAYYEGMLWLAKTYVARERWIEANYFLDKLEKEPAVSDEVRAEAMVSRANYFLQQKDYNNAIPSLQAALESGVDKERKARMAFILAQVYERKGEAQAAFEAYDRVKKFRPSFEMELQTEIKKIQNGWSSGNSNVDKAVKKLDRMAKERKYDEYKGSIYSSAGEMLLASGREDEAFEYFKKAIGGTSSKTVKGELYYRLASLFFSNEDYYQSKLYYDSTLTVLPKSDERYTEVEAFANNLSDIAKNIITIENQDSLLRLGTLSEAQLNAYAKEKAENAWEEKTANEATQGGFTATTSVISGSSKFFAYNQTAKQKGKQAFLKKWGDRPLADNWRLSSKLENVFAEEEEEVVPTMPEAELRKEMNKVLREIPTTPEDRDAANAIIEKALFELGTGFRTRLEKFKKSTEVLEDLLQRYPGTKNKEEAYYFLYLNYIDLNDTSKAESYKNRLFTEFPDSDFTKYLKNPNSTEGLMTEERKIEVYYDKTYALFENREYQAALDQLEKGKETFKKGHELEPKFDLLSAMCLGNLKGQDEYINALRGVILRHKNTPEATHAKEMIRFLRGDQESFTGGGEVDEAILAKFVADDDKLHYVIAVLYDQSDTKAPKEAVTAYNDANHKEKRLRVAAVSLNRDQKSQLLLIRRFANKAASMEYYASINEELDKFLPTKEYSYDTYAINQKNYRQIMKDKSINDYRVYFEQNYLGVD